MKLFFGHNFRHWRKISSLLSDIVLSDKVGDEGAKKEARSYCKRTIMLVKKFLL